MIKLRDAHKLSRTKLRSKRVLLTISVVVSGLLFGVIIAGVLVTSGALTSITNFARSVSDGKYLVKAEPNVSSVVNGQLGGTPSQETVDTLTALQKDYIARQKDIAKRLSTTFDETNLEKILIANPYAPKDAQGTEALTINIKSPVLSLYQAKLETDYVKVAKNKFSDLQLLAKKYGAVGYHSNVNAGTYYRNLTYLKDGREDLSKVGDNAKSAAKGQSVYDYLISSARDSHYVFVDDSLVKRFTLSTNDRKTDPAAVPVVISTTEAVEMFGDKLGVSKMPSDPAAQVDWMKSLQNKINGQTYTACYRNDAELSLLSQASQTALEMAANKGKPDYVKPSAHLCVTGYDVNLWFFRTPCLSL